MTYVVAENCIRCKYTDCVDLCPVDCSCEGETMLVIHPDKCIDDSVCEPECSAEAIKPNTKPDLEPWLTQPGVVARLAEHHPQAGSPARRHGHGRQDRQAGNLVQQPWIGRLAA